MWWEFIDFVNYYCLWLLYFKKSLSRSLKFSPNIAFELCNWDSFKRAQTNHLFDRRGLSAAEI